MLFVVEVVFGKSLHFSWCYNPPNSATLLQLLPAYALLHLCPALSQHFLTSSLLFALCSGFDVQNPQTTHAGTNIPQQNSLSPQISSAKMHNWSEQFCKPAKLTVSVCKQCQCLFKHSWSEPNLQTSNFHSSSSISKQGTLHFLSVVPTSATQISKQFSSSEALSLISDPLSKSTKQCSFHSS